VWGPRHPPARSYDPENEVSQNQACAATYNHSRRSQVLLRRTSAVREHATGSSAVFVVIGRRAATENSSIRFCQVTRRTWSDRSWRVRRGSHSLTEGLVHLSPGAALARARHQHL